MHSKEFSRPLRHRPSARLAATIAGSALAAGLARHPALAASPSAGLIGYYAFDAENIADSSGHGHTGKISGAVTFDAGVGTPGYALRVSASPTPGSANLPPGAFAQTKSLSIAFWFWPSASQAQTYNAMVYRANQVADAPTIGWADRSYAIFWTSGGLHVVYTPAGASSQYICTNQSYGLTSETWHHVALTLDSKSQTATVFVDGASVQTCPYAGGTLASGHKALWLGNTFNQQLGDTGAFTGEIDDVRLYSRAISAKDVKTLYTGQK